MEKTRVENVVVTIFCAVGLIFAMAVLLWTAGEMDPDLEEPSITSTEEAVATTEAITADMPVLEYINTARAVNGMNPLIDDQSYLADTVLSEPDYFNGQISVHDTLDEIVSDAISDPEFKTLSYKVWDDGHITVVFQK